MENNVLMPTEIEFYVDTIPSLSILDLGSTLWIDWHKRCQQLCQQAVIEASAMREETVKEAFISLQKVTDLIYQVIQIIVWKNKVMPILLELEPHPKSTIIAYSILFHEVTCVSLLEIILYHENSWEIISDHSADLLEYLVSSSSHLLSTRYCQEMKNESAKQELERQKTNIGFEIGIKSLTILRYFAENIAKLPIDITNRIYRHYDIPIFLSEILLAAPWNVDDKEYVNGKWKELNYSIVNPAATQCWLGIRQFLLDPVCQKYYAITKNRKGTFLRLLPLMSPVLMDHISPLIELKHWLCRIATMEETSDPPRPINIIEVVLDFKDRIYKDVHKIKGKYRSLAKMQLQSIFNNDKQFIQQTAQKFSEAYNLDFFEKYSTSDITTTNTCVRCEKSSLKRCSRCKKAWYCSRACQVEHWPQHKEYCITEKNETK